MICTSNYKNLGLNKLKNVSISGDRGKLVNYVGECYSELAPKLEFWKIWHKNIGKISEEENNRYYIEEYYKQVLSKLDIDEVYNDLNESILLCYEKGSEFCHRHIVSAWFELILNIPVPEINYNNNSLEIIIPPKYIKEVLNEVIIQNTNMEGFSSLHALYLYQKSIRMKKEADRLENQAYIIDSEYVKKLNKTK